jgi:hypothetical protein
MGPCLTRTCGTTVSHRMTRETEALALSWSSGTPPGSWPLEIAGTRQRMPAIYSAWRT